MPVESSSPEGELKALLAERPVRPQSVSDWLDGLGHEERVRAIRSLGRGPQRRLYEAVDGFRPVYLADLVPPEVDDFAPVRHFGRNTLPLFTRFEKRFCRPRDADARKPGELYGFNFQTLAPLTGPGYFVAREDPGRPEVWVDYNRVPPSPPDAWRDDWPDDWPQIASNAGGLPRLVFGFMVDTLRGVSEHVTIGSAARRGRDLGSWFVLCREI